MDASKVKDWLKLFAKVGIVYHEREVESWWKTFPNHGSDAYESLRIFLGGYAFERQGGSFYAPFACEALKQARPDFLNAAIVWKSFRNEVEKWKLHNQDTSPLRMNESRNPLAPKGTPFLTKSGTAKTSDISNIEFANEIGVPLIDWVHNKLQGEIQNTHDRLCKISGIGTKIASYFMRDVACQNVANQFDCFLSDVSNRHLLQPIDIWTRRAAEGLSTKKFPDDDPTPAAKFIVNESLNAGVSPERVNQGMWYFGAEIAGTDYYLNKLLIDPDGSKRASDDLRKHLQSLQSAASLLGSLDSPPGE
jgi:virulence-associated protein VapD